MSITNSFYFALFSIVIFLVIVAMSCFIYKKKKNINKIGKRFLIIICLLSAFIVGLIFMPVNLNLEKLYNTESVSMNLYITTPSESGGVNMEKTDVAPEIYNELADIINDGFVSSKFFVNEKTAAYSYL